MQLSLVIPTYNEKENIEKLIYRIFKEFKDNKIDGELIIVDDNSPDGTGIILDKLKKKQKKLKVIHRAGKLGLSSAVLEGWKISSGNILGVMDADFSHPPEKIKNLFFAIKNNEADFSIGSRYVKGGKIVGWTPKRKIMSKTATYLSRIYTNVKDPMTGFFMINKEVIKGVDISPKGFKILLEIIIKGKYKNIKEVPITFINRTEGKSKAGTKEIIYYLRNLAGYLPYTKKSIKEFFKFSIVGFLGMLINIAILYFFTEIVGVYYLVSAFFSFLVAMTSNFLLNKTWTFGEKMNINFRKKYLQFGAVSVVALLVNLAFLYLFTDIFGIYYIISQIIAIGLSLIINFLGNKKWTFLKR